MEPEIRTHEGFTVAQGFHEAYKAWLPQSAYEYTPGAADFEHYPPDTTGSDDSPVAVWIPISERA